MHVVRDFAGRSDLFPAERAAFGLLQRERAGAVLDLGVGTGRTTAFLSATARSYCGIDSQPAMVDVCRRRFPGVDVRVGDARDLQGYTSNSYDLVCFSFNGIDSVPHEDRAVVLREILRVLRPGGALLYSTHNLRSIGNRLPGFILPRLHFTPNPVRLGARLLRAAQSLARRAVNRIRFARFERLELDAGWALVNDDAYDHGMLIVYVDPAKDVEALHAAGFDPRVICFDMDGAAVDPQTTRAAWLYVLVRKPA